MDLMKMSGKRNILRAYRHFKQEMLWADKKTVWDNAEKISFVEGVVEYFLHDETIPEVYYQMAVAEPDLLNRMYQAYKESKKATGYAVTDFTEALERILLSWGTYAA